MVEAFALLSILKLLMTEIKKNRQINLLEDPVAPTLKSMTIPMIYGMILLMTFNLVDTFFVGLLGTEPLACLLYTSDAADE